MGTCRGGESQTSSLSQKFGKKSKWNKEGNIPRVKIVVKNMHSPSIDTAGRLVNMGLNVLHVSLYSFHFTTCFGHYQVSNLMLKIYFSATMHLHLTVFTNFSEEVNLYRNYAVGTYKNSSNTI